MVWLKGHLVAEVFDSTWVLLENGLVTELEELLLLVQVHRVKDLVRVSRGEEHSNALSPLTFEDEVGKHDQMHIIPHVSTLAPQVLENLLVVQHYAENQYEYLSLLLNELLLLHSFSVLISLNDEGIGKTVSNIDTVTLTEVGDYV